MLHYEIQGEVRYPLQETLEEVVAVLRETDRRVGTVLAIRLRVGEST